MNPADVTVSNTALAYGDIANYEFDGDYLDSSGNGRHLQNFGTNFSQGVRNQSVEFGNGKYLKLAGNSSGTIKAISIWIYPTSDSAEQMYFYFGAAELYLAFGQRYFISFPRTGCSRIQMNDLPQLNSWNSFIVNLTGSRIQIYLNGIKKIDETCGSFVDFSNEKYFIGSSEESRDYYFRGKMDSYKIFGRSLNITEISDLSSE
jgi:hypothetical protein